MFRSNVGNQWQLSINSCLNEAAELCTVHVPTSDFLNLVRTAYTDRNDHNMNNISFVVLSVTTKHNRVFIHHL